MRIRLILGLTVGLATQAPSASGFELQRTKGGHDVRWEASAVELAIDPSLLTLAYGTADALHDAARAWSGVGGAPAIHVTHGAGGDAIGAVGRNVAFFVPGGYAPANGALAITVVAFDESGRIVDADIVVSGAYRFGVLGTDARGHGSTVVPSDATEPTSNAAALDAGDTFDLGHVLAHEVGHVLGLADGGDTAAVMYRMTAPNDASRRAPNADDVAGAHALYASTPSGCAGASVSPAPPDADASRAALLVAVAAALFVALRGRPRVRAALVLALAAALVLRTPRVAKGDFPARGQARAHVLAAHVDARGPLLATRLALAVDECRVARCPPRVESIVWGGRQGNLTQVVGHAPPPEVGDVVELARVGDGPLRPALGPAFSVAR
jgi:Matrixin